MRQHLAEDSYMVDLSLAEQNMDDHSMAELKIDKDGHTLLLRGKAVPST